jgi:hypothetical protein
MLFTSSSVSGVRLSVKRQSELVVAVKDSSNLVVKDAFASSNSSLFSSVGFTLLVSHPKSKMEMKISAENLKNVFIIKKAVIILNN